MCTCLYPLCILLRAAFLKTLLGSFKLSSVKPALLKLLFASLWLAHHSFDWLKFLESRFSEIDDDSLKLFTFHCLRMQHLDVG